MKSGSFGMVNPGPLAYLAEWLGVAVQCPRRRVRVLACLGYWVYLKNMRNEFSRRKFLRSSVVAATTAAAFHFEEKALLANPQVPSAAPVVPAGPPKSFPCGKIGHVTISRLMCGGNLVSGFAHSRDLIYVSRLLKEYFTDEKVFRTFALCEANGINTAVLRLDENTLRLLRTYWKERGGKIQWLAQIDIRGKDMETEVKQALDHGAVGAFTHGNVGDDYVQDGKVDLLGATVAAIKARGAIAGIAGHSLEVAKECEAAGIKPDFYMKTFNSKRYWSAGPMPRQDSVWEETPEETKQFMEKVNRPWIAYKVLGAGAIHPREGFRYAFYNGADFVCAGMFDFHIEEDAGLAQQAIQKAKDRPRPWCA
jgi:hypothetical protein